jgi:hypothetical protein
MKETQNESTITIEDKIYNKSDLPEGSWIIIENINIIQKKMEDLNETLVIHKIAKDCMVDNLLKSVQNITPIDTLDSKDFEEDFNGEMEIEV